MFSGAFTDRQSPIHACDARVRVVVATVLSFAAALSHTIFGQLIAFACAVSLALVARLPFAATLRRLLPLNIFLMVLWFFLPQTTPGPPAFRLGEIALSQPGLVLALGITLRANAIALLVTALAATLDIVEFGRALHALRVPPKLVTLMLFTVRYTAVLHAEYASLRRAMRVRCFAPRMNAHTLQTLGYLAGMLLVRGFERSGRVLMAMKCRGYTGAFPIREFRALHARDGALATCAGLCLLAICWMEWR